MCFLKNAAAGAAAGTAVSKDRGGPQGQPQNAQRGRRSEETPKFRHGYSSL